MAAGHDDVFHHVRDAGYFELPGHYLLRLPRLFEGTAFEFQITRFMVLQVIAVVLAFLIFRGLAKRMQAGEPVRGRWWNFWEMLALFVRDQVVRPAIGTGHHHEHHHEHEHHHHAEEHAGSAHGVRHKSDAGFEDPGGGHGPYESIETQPTLAERVARHGARAVAVGHPADRFLPFVWTAFFFILINNLLGAIPSLGTATGNISVTAALAFTTLCYVVKCGAGELGAVGFLKAIAPSMDFPGVIGKIIGPPITILIWLIEFAGILIKHAVLAVRLFANIMAGHTVLAVILAFVAQAAGSGFFYLVAPASVFGQVAIGLLELFIAFLQAYVFALLSSLFIGMAVHPH